VLRGFRKLSDYLILIFAFINNDDLIKLVVNRYSLSEQKQYLFNYQIGWMKFWNELFYNVYVYS